MATQKQTSGYVKCTKTEVPDGVIFDVPRANQGQIVEVAYGSFDRDGGCSGDPYKRVTDRSDRSVTYYRLTNVKWRNG